ncbi:MAG: hypothetical protein V3S45_09560, partial [Kiloniellales bacterium]
MTSSPSDESDRPLLAKKGAAQPAVQLPSREPGGEDTLTASPRQTVATALDAALAGPPPAALREDTPDAAAPELRGATEADPPPTESPPASGHEAEPAPAASLSKGDLPIPSAITLEDMPR